MFNFDVALPNRPRVGRKNACRAHFTQANAKIQRTEFRAGDPMIGVNRWLVLHKFSKQFQNQNKKDKGIMYVFTIMELPSERPSLDIWILDEWKYPIFWSAH